MSGQQMSARVPLLGDTFTEEALARLVGQTPTLTLGWDASKSLGRATVVDASQDGDWLVLTIEVPERAVDALKAAREQIGGDDTYGMGYIIRDAYGAGDGDRVFNDIRMHEMTPQPRRQ